MVLALGSIAFAAEPTIDIPNNAAEGSLVDSQRQQVDQYVAYHIGLLARATTQEAVLVERRKLGDSYNRFGTKAQDYMMAFAGAVAAHGKAVLDASGDDSLAALKKVNLAMTVSKMGQVTLAPLATAMVSHPDASVRFFGWEAYTSMRPAVLAAGGKPAQLMLATLADRLQKETDPHVLSQLIRMFVYRGLADLGGQVSQQAYEAGMAGTFKILQANWIGLCRRVLLADGATAEAASTAVEGLARFKVDIAAQAPEKDIAQLLANMAWSAGKAFDTALTGREAAEAAQQAEAATRRASAAPNDATLQATALAAVQKANALAMKAGRDPSKPGPGAAESEFAVNAIGKLLTDCEAGLNTLVQSSNNHIAKNLGATGGDKAALVRLGVLEWINILTKKYDIKKPEDMVVPK